MQYHIFTCITLSINCFRYLTWFEAFLSNIEATHFGAKDMLQNGAIAVACSLLPGSLSAVDKNMEETFMKFAKSTGMCSVHSERQYVNKMYISRAVILFFCRWSFWHFQSCACISTFLSHNFPESTVFPKATRDV